MKSSVPEFPCERLPEDAGAARLLGLYPQKQPGLWMQRVRLGGGAVRSCPREGLAEAARALSGVVIAMDTRWSQWHALAEIARRYTPDAPLHLTTRQDIELHNVTGGNIPKVQHALRDAGLTGLGACGDTLRNVTVCPCSGSRSEMVDLLPLARRIEQVLAEFDGIFSLPRKLKISLSACRSGCGQPWINDLGLVAHQVVGRWGFRVIAGGSLGPRPGTGMLLFDDLPANDVLPLAWATAELFAAHGDREHRGRARLRHVRERFGDEAFSKMMTDALEHAKSSRTWPEIDLGTVENGLFEKMTLHFDNGDLTPEAADAIGELVERHVVHARIGNQHRVMLFGSDRAKLEQWVGEHAALQQAAAPKPLVVACPGTRWCARGLTDANGLGDRIRLELAGAIPDGNAVCISGCPNGCAHSAVADIGLVGGLTTRDGEKTEVYTLFAGGGMGGDARLAREVAKGLTGDEVIAEIRRLVQH